MRLGEETAITGGSKHEFKGNFSKFKWGLKGKESFETQPDSWTAPKGHRQVGGQLPGVRLPIFNLKF